MEAKYPDITLGEPICIKIKQIYFSDVPWPKCYRQVADKFTLFKRILRKFYSIDNNVELLEKTLKYTEQDIIDAFAMEKDILDESKKINDKPKYGDSVQWVPVPRDKPELLTKIKRMLEE